MLGHVLRRLVYLVTLATCATVIAYLLAATQLNPRAQYQASNPPPPEHVVDSLLLERNLNDKTPVTQRLAIWGTGVLRGDLGLTVAGRRVNDEIGRRIWVSVRLMLLGTILGTLLGVVAGAYAAVRQYKTFDHVLTTFSFVVLATPVVVTAVLFKVAGIGLNNALGFTLVYTSGEISPGVDTWSFGGIIDRLGHLALPTMVLMVIAMAFYSRYQRSAMLDVIGSDFLRTAQAKGLRRSQSLAKHGLRMALIPMATLFAFQLTLIFVGASFTEIIFGWHGMGEYFVHSVTKSDVNSVAAVTLCVAVLILVAGIIAEIAIVALDPRVASGATEPQEAA